jgi:hypothetical protein
MNNVVAASRTVGFIETRDLTLRKSLERLPEVVAVTVAEEAAAPTGAEKEKEDAGGDTGLLYLVHDFKSAAAWEMGPSYDTLPLDPYLEGIGAGRFRAYSKFAYVFPGKKPPSRRPSRDSASERARTTLSSFRATRTFRTTTF